VSRSAGAVTEEAIASHCRTHSASASSVATPASPPADDGGDVVRAASTPSPHFTPSIAAARRTRNQRASPVAATATGAALAAGDGVNGAAIPLPLLAAGDGDRMAGGAGDGCRGACGLTNPTPPAADEDVVAGDVTRGAEAAGDGRAGTMAIDVEVGCAADGAAAWRAVGPSVSP